MLDVTHMHEASLFNSVYYVRIDCNWIIKVADFGLSESMVGSKNYFRQSQESSLKKLPIKWMAPESLHDGIFSEKTDVVRQNGALNVPCMPFNDTWHYSNHICSDIATVALSPNGSAWEAILVLLSH